MRRPLGAQAVQPRTQAMKEAVALGRASLMLVSAGSAFPLMVGTFYGWPCAKSGPVKLARTAAVIQALLDEIGCWPAVPTVLMGDLNAPVAQVSSLGPRLVAGEWHDLGHIASAWGALTTKRQLGLTMRLCPVGQITFL